MVRKLGGSLGENPCRGLGECVSRVFEVLEEFRASDVRKTQFVA